MEYEEKDMQKIDLFVLIDDVLRTIKRLWVLLVVFAVIGGGIQGFAQKRSYTPTYEAYASFMVRVADPFYATASSYNTKTAEVMAATFPSIVSSGVLQKKVMEELDVTYLPSLTVSATGGSSILTMSCQHTDPQFANDVLNSVIKYYPEVAEFVVGATELELLDESGVPQEPINRFDPRASIKSGVMDGVKLWVLLVALLVLLKNTIHNEAELKRTVNAPCLSQIPALRGSNRQTYTMLNKGKKAPGFEEAIRLLRLRVEKAMEEGDKKVLLVSSAIPGEGKTTVAVNLGISLARKGRRVLVVDCDLRNPSVSRSLQVSTKNSMIDYLRGRVTIRDMIQPTAQENLFVISGGTGDKSDYAALLSQERTARLIQAARNLFDYVIVDTPPCSMLADAAEVAELAECGLMVVRQDYAARDQIVDGIQRLSDGDLQMLGCAFNGVRKTLGNASDYGYGYGYGGYGYGGYGYGSKK